VEDYARAMLNEAMSRLNDADLLSQNLQRASDADALLRVLAFEILLKCALVVTGTRPARTHNYAELWAALPPVAQDAIVSHATVRMPGHADLSDISSLLKTYQFLFERARYNYEIYEGYSAAEKQDLGELWVAAGAVAKEALVQYHPLELACLIYGLESYIESVP
jgi:hypothetical protein